MAKKSRGIFYGWWVVAACFLISFYVQGVVGFGFTVLLKPLHDEFGWSYAQISVASSLRGLEVGLFAPVIGVLVDRFGPRRLLLVGGILAGAGLFLVSRTTSLWTFYGTFVLLAVGVSALSPTVTMTAVTNWFRKKVGLATGIMQSGVGFSGFMVAVLVTLVDRQGWRAAMFILGLGLPLVVVPLALLVRHKPERYGLLPDGEANGSLNNSLVAEEDLQSSSGIDISAREAVRGSAFWHIALAMMIHLFVVNAVITQVLPYLDSIGMSKELAGLVASAIPLVSICGRMSFGWLGDRVDARWVMASGYAMMGFGLFLYAWAANGALGLVAPFVAIFSSGFGGNAILRAVLVREYFGRRSFGTIHGFVMGIGVIGNIAGPPLAGWVFDKWHTYQSIWFVLAAVSLVAVALIITLPRMHSSRRLSVK